METLIYPLYYRVLDDQTVAASLPGTAIQGIGQDIATLKTKFSDELFKFYKKNNDYPLPLFSGALKLKKIDVIYRPLHKLNGTYLPIGSALSVPIRVIVGNKYNAQAFEAYIPDFNLGFSFYDLRQLESLVNGFALQSLADMDLRKIHNMILLDNSGLDLVELKINTDKKISSFNIGNVRNSAQLLKTYAEQFPAKNTGTQTLKYPEAAWGLEDKVSAAVEKILGGRNSLLLIGASGSGKTTVIRQAIRKILKNKQLNLSFWQIQSQRITAKAKYLGEWQKNVEQIIEELKTVNGILWVTDMIRLLESGGEGPEDSIAAFIRPFLSKGSLQLIGEMSPAEFDSIKKHLPGFAAHFSVIELEEMPESEMMNILDKLAVFAADQLKIKTDQQTLNLAYRLLDRYLPYEQFPGKAVRFLGSCFAEAMKKKSKTVDKKLLLKNFVQQTGLPELFLDDAQVLDTAGTQRYFKNRIIGQPEAIEALSGIVKIFKAGLNNPNRPISTLIFTGPTGVGKTSAAKALSDYFFGKGQQKSALIRLDMSEFQHASSIYRLIGSGSAPGLLFKEIRQRPFSVLLFDEIEKADPLVFDVLLNVLDEGLLRDNFGRVADFRNAIIIMTSNLGAAKRSAPGFKDIPESDYASALKSFFRPEFLNRIDQIVSFRPLGKDEILGITRKELLELNNREGFVKKSIHLDFSEALINYLADYAYDERYGARPLQRALEQKVISALAAWMLQHRNLENLRLKLDVEAGEILINIEK